MIGRSPPSVARAGLIAAIIVGTTFWSGCGSRPIYKPNPPLQGALSLRVAIAVLPFEDRSPGFAVKRYGASMEDFDQNMVKSGSHCCPKLDPALVSQWLAEDLAASGAFGSARFAADETDLTTATVVLQGAILDATAKQRSSGAGNEFDFRLALHAVSRPGNQVVSSGIVELAEQPRGEAGVALNEQAVYDSLRALFAKVRDRLRTDLQLPGPSSSRPSSSAPANPSAPPQPSPNRP